MLESLSAEIRLLKIHRKAPSFTLYWETVFRAGPEAVLEQASCMLSDSCIDQHFERHLPERQLKFAAKLHQTKVGNGSAQVH